jgi:hypothetical protein
MVQRDDERPRGYDPDEHDKGEWRRDQITDEEWRDYDWVKVEGFGESPRYVRGLPKG